MKCYKRSLHLVCTYIYWLWISHRRLHAVWFYSGSTTATLCSTALHPAPSTSWVQNNPARIVHKAPRRSHAYPLLKKWHWLPVEQRISYKLALLTFKMRQTSAPAYLSQHTIARSGTRSQRSSDVPLLHVPFRWTAIGKRTFSAAPTTWNSLPASVINCDTLSVFKSRLKTHIFNFAYS